MKVGSRFQTRVVTRFENLDFVRSLLFSLLKNSVDERGHLLRILHAPCRVSFRNVAVIKKRTTAIRDWQMQFYIKSKPISVRVSINDRLNYIAYVIGKGIKCPNLSPFHGLWQFYFNRGPQRQKTATCTIL